MPYRKGRPLVDTSLPFRIAAAMTFYAVWPLAQMVNLVSYSTRYKNLQKLLHIPRAVLVSNHTTFLDPVLVSGAVLPGRTWQTMLEQTAEAPFIGTLTRLLGGVPLPAGLYGIKRIMGLSETLFRYRRFIHFYPEGECFLYNQRIREFRPGAFLLAAQLDIPVIPLLTVFHGGFFRPGTLLGRILPLQRMVVLDPVYPSGYIKRDEKGEIMPASVRDFAGAVRTIMQQEIDRRGGTSAFYRGQMARTRGVN
jgi:1-acyl-sn-glycerol-3-phosphate acyltransferase